MNAFPQLFGSLTTDAQQMVHLVLRLVLAAFLGGVIGLERETKHKPAGLRTQMFICFGSALFTILSERLASTWGGDHTRIAAQIIPGIGFIGAGSILHSRGSVTGLTTAATLFVVASIGMAAGGGMYLPAIFAAALVLLSLLLLGWMEERFSLKALVMVYEVSSGDTEQALAAVNQVMDDQQQAMQRVQIAREDHTTRINFSVDASRREHEALLRQLRQTQTFQRVSSLGPAEHE